MKDSIKIKGARVHNLKNIDIEIPCKKFVVITGLSGSGKSSLAFDTIYAEGQRRYVESLSSYARQFVGMLNKPEVDSMEGLSPAISIDQKSTSRNPRSTVGTITEIYDYLRLLFARIGKPHCHICGKIIKKHSVNEIIKQIKKNYFNENIIILSPIIKDKKGEHKNILNKINESGFNKVRFDKNIYSLEEIIDMDIDQSKKHNLDIVIGYLKITKNKEDIEEMINNIKIALELSNGLVIISPVNTKNTNEKIFSQLLICPNCGTSLPELEPRNFSFNSPHGACPDCNGLGVKLKIDPKLILNYNLTIAQGGIKPYLYSKKNKNSFLLSLKNISKKNGFNLNTPIKNLNEKQLNIILYGSKKSIEKFDGVIPNLEKQNKEKKSKNEKKETEKYSRAFVCSTCSGKRLKPEMLAIKIDNLSIYDITTKSINETKKFFINLEKSDKLSEINKKIANPILKEICHRLTFLSNVGLNYLTLSRPANTLSGGEAQRIKLATQIGSSLTGIIYVLDEPSIGLHQRDNDKLIDTIKKLRDIGNTVIVVEHDKSIMEKADYIIDIGPYAGEHGGKIIAKGSPSQIKKFSNSLTGQYLSGVKLIQKPKKYRKGNGKFIKIINASEHNLKNIDVEFPLGKFIAITGVSGSGKSTLISNILSRTLSQTFYKSKAIPGKHKRIDGINNIDKIINIDQSPIGKTPRSNPATYVGAFTSIRELFANLPESKIRGYNAGQFSFNVPGGRCKSCLGDGIIKIEMQFLPNIYIKCDACNGKRYNKKTLEIYYKNNCNNEIKQNISDILNMTVENAMNFFKNIPAIHTKLSTLNNVGLGYIKLGQSATTLSGGESQRIKLSAELARPATGKTLYILDEPTTGLHFEDIKKLLSILNQLVDKGNTVLIIEHNLDVVKSVDHIIDLGPEGGKNGGKIIVTGTPEEIINYNNLKNKSDPFSYTGEYLSK